jgi:hypothetical protein
MKSHHIGISFFWLALLAINSCTCLASQEDQRPEPTPHQKIYFFQHKLIPEWTHRTNGAFFGDLSNGRHQRLLDIAAEIVSPEFSNGISIKPYPKVGGLLISFPTPVEPPECYFIYIHKDPKKHAFSLFTYEKTRDPFGRGNKGVVGSWSADGEHGNHGSRTYEDAGSFVTEMQGPAER